MTTRWPCTVVAMLCCLFTLALAVLVLTASRAFADHERFTVGEMRNVDPSADIISSVSGACVPTHDRTRLDCYFTSFSFWKSRNVADMDKEWEQVLQGSKKNPNEQVNELKRICSEPWIKITDPIRLKYGSASFRAFMNASREFCEHPNRETALTVLRATVYGDAKKCRCNVSDWYSTFARNVDRWVETSGPSGLCGVVKVTTLVPNELAKMKEAAGPILWRLDERRVVTRSDTEFCKFFKIKDDAVSLAWNAPLKSIECDEFEFTSALEGMSNPRGPKGK